jgi:hypothetical protein
MVKQKLMTLTSDGYISDEKTIAVKLYSYFISSDYSQTRFWIGEVLSLKYLLMEYQHDLEGMRTAIHDNLELLYDKYISDVDIIVNIVLEGGNGQVNLTVSGKTWSLVEGIKVSGFNIDLLDGFENLNIEGLHNG